MVSGIRSARTDRSLCNKNIRRHTFIAASNQTIHRFTYILDSVPLNSVLLLTLLTPPSRSLSLPKFPALSLCLI